MELSEFCESLFLIFKMGIMVSNSIAIASELSGSSQYVGDVVTVLLLLSRSSDIFKVPTMCHCKQEGGDRLRCQSQVLTSTQSVPSALTVADSSKALG